MVWITKLAFEPQESESTVHTLNHRMTVTTADLAEGDENIQCEVMIPTLKGFKEMTKHGNNIVTSQHRQPS